jgi:cell division cycle protein 20 (cofactor of APC complex)
MNRLGAADASTPAQSHKVVLTTRAAGGRMPLTPSPNQQRVPTSANLDSSPLGPERKSSSDFFKGLTKTSKPSSLSSSRSIAQTKSSQTTQVTQATAQQPEAQSQTTTQQSNHNQSTSTPKPKSNIARSSKAGTPRKALELGVSDFSLAGTGTTANTTPKPKVSKAKKVRAKASKTTVTYAASDRFIANRGASSGIANAGSGKLERTKSNSSSGSSSSVAADGSANLASDAEDAMAALEGLSILEAGNDDDGNDEIASYARPSPNTVAYTDSLASACGVNLSTRILQFKPAPPESSKPIDLRQQYNRPLRAAGGAAAQFRRRVATAPERVLDAPGLIDDYYLNLLDWSSGNQVAIGLERNVYVWSADEGAVSCLLEAPADTYVSSVKWSGDGAYVGVGLGTGEVQIWDVGEQQKVRSMFGHDTRVGVMGWSKHLLSTGARSGLVFNHDVRVAEHKVAELVSHTSEVCGLEWRSDGAQLATGGNDNLVSIWDARSLTVPKFTKANHKAAVKALAWCPWNINLLATGGGSYDRHIHFWNSISGARVNSIDTGSQVTSLRWSPHYREIVSSSGFPDNSLSIWSYPTLVKNVEIPAHESRVLHSCLSPDGQMLATAAADESLKFWKVFEKKAGPAGAGSGGAASGKADLTKSMTIR